jgi:uncharacterized lipoprotein
LRQFVRRQGLPIAEADPTHGIIETGWAERFDGPEPGGLTGLLNTALDFAAGGDKVQDRYQFQLERLDDGGSRILVAHRSAEQVRRERSRGPVGGGESDIEIAWEQTEGDPAVRAAMTKRLLVYLGMNAQRAQGMVVEAPSSSIRGPTPQFFLTEGGRAWIVVPDRRVRRVFARVEIALEEMGAEIVQSNFAERRIRIEWAPPTDDGNEVQRRKLTVFVRAGDEEGRTRITAGDAEGRPRSGDTQKALLRAMTRALGGNPGDVQQPAETPSDREGGAPRSIMSPRRDN